MVFCTYGFEFHPDEREREPSSGASAFRAPVQQTAGPFDSSLWKDNQWMACNGAPPEITDCSVLTGALTWEVFFFPSRLWIPALNSYCEEELINISLEKWRQANAMCILSKL